MDGISFGPSDAGSFVRCLFTIAGIVLLLTQFRSVGILPAFQKMKNNAFFF